MDKSFTAMMRDAFAGEDAIKGRSMAAYQSSKNTGNIWGKFDRCLFVPGAYDDEEAAAMLHRAHYPHVVRRTLSGIVSRAFSKPVETDADGLDELDFEGRNLEGLLRAILSEHALVGFSGVLVDFDEAPVFIHHKDETILEHHMDRRRLVHLALDESGDELINGEIITRTLRRVYGINEGSVFSRLDEYDNDNKIWVEGEIVLPQSASGPLNEIPFVFIGEPDQDNSLMEPLARLALKYMDQSAQLNYAASKVGQPTPYIVWGVEAEDLGPWQALIAENGIRLGSSSMVQLPKDSQFGFAEFTGSGLQVFRDEMAELISLMISAGARALADISTGNVKPETMRMINSGESSTLMDIVSVVEAGFNRALEIAASFVSNAPSQEIRMNRDFFDDNVTAQDITSLSQAVIAGTFPQELFNEALRRGGWTDLNDGELADLNTTGI